MCGGGGWEGKGGQEVRLSQGSLLSDGGPSQGVWPGRKRPGLRCIQQSSLARAEVGPQGGEVGSGYQDPAVTRVSREAVCACVHLHVCASLHAEIIVTRVSESSKSIDI